ncbi:RNA polymerase sigma factor [Streptodolium elevatio]|uniref:Sigma-70 family RNA polymerase sigma factor n=1 Tax=Streptodolium elevatio TaxID=3157996 RepID=A0ABV3DR02_9ACTN
MTTENTLSLPFGPTRRPILRRPSRTRAQDLAGVLLRMGRELADRHEDLRPPADDLPSGVTAAPPGGLTITDLYHGHRVELVRLAALLVDDVDAAQDIVQDTFAATYRRYGARMTGVDDPLRYLRRGVVNGSRSLLRRRRTARAWVPPQLPPAPSPEEDAVRAESDRELRAALDRLRPRQREVLVLRYFAGLSEADIARTLRVPQGTVKSTANRALKALHRMLEPTR